MIKALATVEARTLQSRIIEWTQSLDRRAIFFITLIVATLFFAQYRFWEQPSGSDRANWDYISQVIARGGVPYRDVVNIKTPLSAYIGAGAILIARPFGVRDIFAIRIAFLLLAALTVSFTVLIGLGYLKDRRIALLAPAIMMSFSVFGETNSNGVQPKTPMVLFGLMALWAIQKDRPFFAGLFGMLSALSWQPGLLFVGVAGLAFSKYLTSWREMKVMKVVAGAALPLAVFVFYFWVAGALRDLYLWTVHFNYSVYGPLQGRTLAGFFDRLIRMLGGIHRDERFYFYLAGLGIAIALLLELSLAAKERGRYLLDGAARRAMIVAPMVYFLFCMINIQGGADLIPLLPFIAIFAALALIWLLDHAADLLLRAQPKFPTAVIKGWGFAGALALILILNAAKALSTRIDFPTLQDQELEIAEMKSLLAPGDKIFVQGAAEILVLSGLPNASKHYFLDRGKDNYLDRVEPGGFDGWLDRLKAERPKLVAIERTKQVERKDDLYDWMRADYDEHKGRVFTYYVRKEANAE